MSLLVINETGNEKCEILASPYRRNRHDLIQGESKLSTWEEICQKRAEKKWVGGHYSTHFLV